MGRVHLHPWALTGQGVGRALGVSVVLTQAAGVGLKRPQVGVSSGPGWFRQAPSDPVRLAITARLVPRVREPLLTAAELLHDGGRYFLVSDDDEAAQPFAAHGDG